MKDYGGVSHEDFYRAVLALVEGMSAADILAIPGVWELVSEELNNEALEGATDDQS